MAQESGVDVIRVPKGLIVIGSEVHREHASVDIRDKVCKHPGPICCEGEKSPEGA